MCPMTRLKIITTKIQDFTRGRWIFIDIEVTGTLILSYSNCKREAWLMAHRMIPEQDNIFLELGKLIHDTSYESKGERDVQIHNMRLDIVQEKDHKTIVGEIKKSSHSLKGAKDQLLYYLLRLKNMGIKAEGVMLVPKEKERIPITLTLNEEKRIEKMCKEIKELVEKPIPPISRKQSSCKNCAFYTYCWV